MKWTYVINQKIKVALLLMVAFAVVFINNWVEKSNVSVLGTSFSSVYEDRLLAESYIYELSDLLHQRSDLIRNWEGAGALNDFEENIIINDSAIDELIDAYEKTKLTESENTLFLAVKMNLVSIRKSEFTLSNPGLNSLEIESSKQAVNLHYTALFENLRKLSRIQVSEGKVLNDKAKSIVAGSKLLSQMEIVVLLGMIIFIQTLIFAQKSFISRFPQSPGLN